jgi:hypothetical protein
MSVSEELSKIERCSYSNFEHLSFNKVKIFPSSNVSDDNVVKSGVTISDIMNWITTNIKNPIRELSFSYTAITNKEAIEICNFIISLPKVFSSLRNLYFYKTNVVFNGFKSEIAQILIKTIRTIKNLHIHINHKNSICNDFSIEYMDVIEGLFISNMSTRLVWNVCLESLFRNVGVYYDSDVGCRCTHIKFTNKNIVGDTDDLLGLEVENSRFVLDLKLISKGITKYCNEPIYELILDYNRIEYTYGFEQLCEYCLDSSLFTSDVFRYLSVRDNKLEFRTCNNKIFPLLMEMLMRFPNLTIDLRDNYIDLSDYQCDYEDIIDRLLYDKQNQLNDIRSKIKPHTNSNSITFKEFMKFKKMYDSGITLEEFRKFEKIYEMSNE